MRSNTTRDNGPKPTSGGNYRKAVKSDAQRTLAVKYSRALTAFVERLQEQRGEALKRADSTVKDVVYTVVPGRRFDTIKESVVRSYTKTQTLFFVDRASGTIYGKKSEVAFNENHWMDTIYVARRWDWSLEFPEPKASFREEYTAGRNYGTYKHFSPRKGRRVA
jgi:hypothetical protein